MTVVGAQLPPAPAVDTTERAGAGVPMSVVYTGAFALAGIAVGLRQLKDNSFMWHLRTGNLILDHGIPRSDPYSFTAAGTHWVAQSWLAEVWYALVDRTVGGFGLRIFDAVLCALVSVFFFRIALRLAGDRLRAFLLAALSFIVALQVFSERPLMLGLLAMVLVTMICELPASWIGRRPRIAIPVVMWLWINVHGTFALGFGYLVLHLVGRALEGAPPTKGRERELAIGTGIAAAVSVLNPYALDLVLFPVRLMGRGQVLKGVQEWQSPNFRELGGMLFGLWIVVFILLVARHRVGLRDLLVAIVFLLLGLWAIRNVGLAVAATLPIVARAWHGEADERTSDDRRPTNNLMLIALAFGALALGVRAASQPTWALDRYPVRAFTAIQKQHLEGRRLVTTDGWGGYLIARAWPQQHVFFDDRYDMYPLAVNDTYDTLASLRPGWDAALDRYRIDVVMWPRTGPLAQALALRNDWQRVYSDKLAVVYARRSVIQSAGDAR